MRILDRHIRQALISMCLIVGLALVGISGFITLVEELDDLGKGAYGIQQVGIVALLKLPELAYEMFPLIVLLGAILGLGGLAAGGELVVMQAAGISVLRIAWSAMKAGLLLGVLCLALGEYLLPWSKATADEIKAEARFGSAAAHRGFWLREGDTYIRFGSLPSDDVGESVQAFSINRNDQRLVRTSLMGQVKYSNGRWIAEDVKTTDVAYGSVHTQSMEKAEWPVSLKPDLLRLFVLRADSLSLRGLNDYIGYLQENGLDASEPKYAFWRKLAAPLTVMVMILLAVPFVLGSLRDTGAGQRLFIGVMVGIAFYLVNEVAGSLGQVYHWQAPLVALAPTVALAVIAAWRMANLGTR